jgi:hypothetical protein
MDYLILITLIIIFLLRQYESILRDKIEKAKDSFVKTKLINSVENIDKICAFLVTILIIEIIIWLVKL